MGPAAKVLAGRTNRYRCRCRTWACARFKTQTHDRRWWIQDNKSSRPLHQTGDVHDAL